jgi:hypothetical protein
MCRPQSISAEDLDVLFDNGEDISQHMNDERTERPIPHRGSFKSDCHPGFRQDDNSF